jgi:catechol 2,3-dioxygenase-like lactoylglutathione lyase family enzyme
MAPRRIEQQVTFLYVAELESVLNFYHSVMGFPLVLDQGDCKLLRVGPDSFLGLCRNSGTQHIAGEGPQPGVIFGIVSPDVDAWHTHLVAQGVPIVKPPTLYEKYAIYHMFIRDPAGYLIEIEELRQPEWPKPTNRGQTISDQRR